jgi:hypothetical protein
MHTYIHTHIHTVQHLQAHRLVDDLDDAPVLRVTRVKALRLENFLHIDPQTLCSLHIFHQDAHPSISGFGSAKEGLSLFSLLVSNLYGVT